MDMAKADKNKRQRAPKMTKESLRELEPDAVIDLLLKVYEQNERLSALLQGMVNDKYSSKNEKFENPDQLNVFGKGGIPASATEAPEHDQAPAKPVETPAKKKPGKSHFRNPSPSLLVHEKIFGQPLAADDFACKHCSASLSKAREIVRNWRYEFKPAEIFIQDFVATIFECTSCGHSKVIEPPAHNMAGCTAGPELLAEIVANKFEDHLPLYRQEQRFSRLGSPISKSTMSDWVKYVADVFMPVYEAMHKMLLSSDIVETDDTTVKTQDRNNKKNIKRTNLWIYRGDKNHPVNMFDFTTSRGRAGPMKFLGSFKGFLQGDCFSGNLAVCAASCSIFVACGAHGRRYMFKALGNDKELATIGMQMWNDLFQIERDIESLGLSVADVKKMREQEARPIWNAMHAWLTEQSLTMLPQSAFGKAVIYTLNNWTELTNYMLDGRLRLDNNLAEQEMKRVATGRKNWLFFGSDDGGRRAAVLMSIISTCHRNAVNAKKYIADVLQRLKMDPTQPVENLLPWTWQKNLDSAEIEPCHIAPKISAA
jgi:transposase